MSYNIDSNQTEILLRWKDPEIVGFTKVSTNNKIWISQELSFNEQNRIFKSLDQLKFFYPDNNEQLMLSFSLVEKDFKKQEIMLPPPKAGAKEISVCCVKYIAYENQGNLKEYVLTAEENSRLGIINVNQEKFTQSKFKELYQHQKQSYAHFILPYQLIQENGTTILKLIVGLNIEDTLMLCVDLQNLQVLSSNIYQFSSTLKPGITNGLMFREGKYLLISTSDYKVKIFRTKDFKQIVSLTMHDNYINSLFLTKSDESQKEYLVSCSEDKDFCILDFSSLKK